MNFTEIKALPILFTSKPFGNDHVRKTSWEETQREYDRLRRNGFTGKMAAITVFVSECKDGTIVQKYELHGKA